MFSVAQFVFSNVENKIDQHQTELTMMTGLVSQGKPKEVEEEEGHRS
jgi:hypothetical protein